MDKYPVRLGRHLLLLERLSVGGMAEVFRAKALGVQGFEKIVAVKRILPALAQSDDIVDMFIDEARIVSRLSHPNIVETYELGHQEDVYFISMEYVAGRNLRDVLDVHRRRRTVMDPAAAYFIMARLCEALDYAHRKRDPSGRPLGIIHRDVTPQNVMISYEGEVKLCDFGIAKAAQRASRTASGVVKGKFAYMSPEQVNRQSADRRSDIFALGAVFYEVLTGRQLFAGETDLATIEAIRLARVPSPRILNSAVSPRVEAILMRMLAREPKDRYAWASDVYDDLVSVMLEHGQLFVNRHLRAWMQATFAHQLEAENRKMQGLHANGAWARRNLYHARWRVRFSIASG